MASDAKLQAAQQTRQLLAQLLTDSTRGGGEPSNPIFKAVEHALEHHSFADINPRVVDTNVEGLMQMFVLHAQHSKKQSADQLIDRCDVAKLCRIACPSMKSRHLDNWHGLQAQFALHSGWARCFCAIIVPPRHIHAAGSQYLESGFMQ
jgi:hypothetical protein